jgi:hypothetical protein
VLQGRLTYQQAQTARVPHRVEAKTAKARDVTRFLVGMFRDADPFQQATSASTVRSLSRLVYDTSGQ